MLVSAIIEAAMRKLGVVASGETPTSNEQQDGLSVLQSMLRSWSAEKINVFSSVHETFTLVAGTETYTWGVGGVINTLRPNKVLGVSISDGSVTYPVDIISEDRYRGITVKPTTGRPYYLYPSYEYPYIKIYLYPVPSAVETLVLDSLKPFTETSSFAAVSDTLAMPVNYEEPVIYNLAVRLAPEYGKVISPAVAAIAVTSYDRMVALNSGNFVEPVMLVFPTGSRGGYNINSDSYR